MKKILSVMLAIMMLFTALSVSASAATPSDYWNTQVADGIVVSESTHTILVFDFNGGTSTLTLNVFDSTQNGFVATDGVGDKYIMLPGCTSDTYLTAGSYVTAPHVDAPENMKFNGWYCWSNNEYYIGGERIEIQEDWIGKVVEFQANIIPAKAEGDTLKTILGVLTKVFGTIIGILFLDGNSASGVELVNKLLAGIM